jgi:hypothetical protein
LNPATTRQQFDTVNAVEQSEWSHVVISGARGRVVVQEFERDPTEVPLIAQVLADGARLIIIKFIDGLNLKDLQGMR